MDYSDMPSNVSYINKMKKQSERDAAIAAGETTYFTGLSCRNGHVSSRYEA